LSAKALLDLQTLLEPAQWLLVFIVQLSSNSQDSSYLS